jgi:hypothetical protein
MLAGLAKLAKASSVSKVGDMSAGASRLLGSAASV